NASYKNTDNDPRGVWTSGDLSARNLSARNFYGAGTYPITCPSGRIIEGPPNGMFWRVSKEKFASMDEDKRIWWGADGNNTPRIKRFLTEVKQGVVPQTLWMNFDVGNTQEAKKEVVAIFGSENFMTPKPERLLQRVLHIATNENDLILDSFLGSGTTAAVAHKMRRRWIGIEMGEHAATHCLPRLQKVIDGEQGGISKAVEWAGGGGFRFMRLGEAVFDEKGSINPAVCFATLAAFVWQQETGSVLDATTARPGTPYLGTHYEIDSYKPPQILPQGMIEPVKKAAFCCYLLYNGILGDKRPASGNVLTRDVLAALLALHATTPDPAAPLLVYGEACRLGAERLKQANVTFKHIPYDVKGR
ncbi:MAG: site-specific DNA-methyltransferase, partial [Polaromonas sp.]